MEFFNTITTSLSWLWAHIHVGSLIIALGAGAFLTLSLKKRTGTFCFANIMQALLVTIALYGVLFFMTPTKKPQPKVNANNMLVVGTTADFPPFEFVLDSKIVGFDIDIVNEVAKRIGKEISFKNLPFDTLLSELQLGNVHLLASGLTPTPEKAKRVLFTKPYISDIPLIVISLAKNPPFTSMEELTRKNLVVNAGYTADMYMSKIEGPVLTRLPSAAEGFLAVKSGRADAFVTAKNTVKPFLDKQPANTFNIYVIPDTNESDALAISKKYPELLPKVQHALDAMEKDSTIKTLMKKWKLA